MGDSAPAATASSSVDPLSASGGGICPTGAAPRTGDEGGSDADRCVEPAPRNPPDDEATWPKAAPAPAAPPRPEDTEEVLMASDARDRRASSRRMRSSYDATCRNARFSLVDQRILAHIAVHVLCATCHEKSRLLTRSICQLHSSMTHGHGGAGAASSWTVEFVVNTRPHLLARRRQLPLQLQDQIVLRRKRRPEAGRRAGRTACRQKNWQSHHRHELNTNTSTAQPLAPGTHRKNT